MTAAGFGAPAGSRRAAGPAKIARLALEGVEAGRYEVLADDLSRQVKAALSADPSALCPQIAAGRAA